MYAVARAYYIAHGDLNVPSNHVTPEGKRLGAWLNRQRQIRSPAAPAAQISLRILNADVNE